MRLISKISAVFALALTLGNSMPGLADEQDDLTKALDDAVFYNMAMTWACRDALGGTAQYQAAITIAEGAVVLSGIPRDDAVIFVDQMDKKFRDDPRSKHPDPKTITAEVCSEMAVDQMQKIDVATAKLRKYRKDH